MPLPLNRLIAAGDGARPEKGDIDTILADFSKTDCYRG